MYQVWVWNDLQGDFVVERDKDNKPIYYDNEMDAINKQSAYIADNVRARVEYVRRQFLEKRKKKPAYQRASRIQRIQTRVWAGERVAITPVAFDSNGKLKKVHLKKGEH